MVNAIFMKSRGNQMMATRKNTSKPPTKYLMNFDLAVARGAG